MDLDIPVRLVLGHAAWTWSWTIDLNSGHAPRSRTCTVDAGMPIQSLVRHRQVSISLQRLVRHWHSGIMFIPVLLITD
jgi:uncharacterized protein YmfQ (DUF2313 family)